MWVGVDRLGGLLLDGCLSALVLWSVTALAMLGCRQPARRLRLARAAVLGSLALWPLIARESVPRLELGTALRGLGVLPHPLLSPGWGSVQPVAGSGAAVASGALLVTAESSAVLVWGVRALAVAYVAGVAAGVAWLALGCLAVWWLTRRATEPSPEARALYESLPFDSWRRRPAARVSERVNRPVLVGAVRPLILVPPGLDQPGEHGRLRLSLLHELAHAEGGDPWHGLLANLARALWFFAPPLWWVAKQARLDQEYLADRRAALGFGPPRDYASLLLEFASARADAPAPGGPRGGDPVGDGSPLFRRVLMLLRCPFPVEARPPAWWSWGLPCLTVLVTLGVSSLSFRPPDAPAPGPRPAHAFHVSLLQTRAAPAGPHGRAPLFELPVRLPERFELKLDVYGNPATLALTRVAGLPLDLPAPPAPDLDAPRWHPVRLARDRDGVRLWIDGRAVPLGRTPPPLTAWLSLEPPPDLDGSIRALVLTW